MTPFHSLSVESHLLSVRQFSMVWVTGFTLLHFWAVLCYHAIFCRKFWEDIGIVAVDQNAGDTQNDQNKNETSRKWQGENGVLYRLVHTFASVVFHSEWDKVDRTVLLDDSTVLIVRQLLLTFLGPSSAYFAFLFVGRGLTRDLSGICCGQDLPQIHYSNAQKMMLYRFFTIGVIALQLIAMCRSKLRNWFEAVHNAARDDRYLVGVTLLEYVVQ